MWAERPEWADGLVWQVEAEFADTGATTPSWPDPHETGDPDRLAYSVCSDRTKYRILGSRLEAWARALDVLGLAVATWAEAPYERWVGEQRSPDQWQQLRVLTPVAEGGLSLFAATTLVDGEAFGLDVGVGGAGLPTVLLESVPDCGCDHCDHGSDGELELLDGLVLTVARGGVVHARDGKSSTTAGLTGWSASNHAPVGWLDPGLPVPGTVQRWSGAPWRS